MCIIKSICGRKKACSHHVKVFRSLIVFCFMFPAIAAGTGSAPAVEPSPAVPLRLNRVRSVHDKTFSAFIFKFDNTVQLAEPQVGKDAVIVKFKNATTNLKPYRKYKTLDSWVALEQEPEALTARIGLPKNYSKYSHYLNRRRNKWIIKLYKPDQASPPPSEKPAAVIAENPDKRDKKPVKPGQEPVKEVPQPIPPEVPVSNPSPVETASKVKDPIQENGKKRDKVTANGLLTMNFYQSDIQEVLSALAMERELNIATAQNVSGRISVHLYQVTLAEALDAIALAGGFQYRKQNGLYYIYKPKKIKDPQAKPHQMKIFKLKYAKMEKIQEILKALPDMGTIQTHTASRTLVVDDTPDNIQKIETILGYWDQKPKQVMIEAKILQVGLTDDMAFGVDWAKILGELNIGTDGFSKANLPITGPVTPIPGNATGVFTNLITAIGTNYQFSMALDALQHKTKVNTLSTPKVLAIHGKPAKVQVGGQQGYRVTTTNLGVATESIEFINTGTILEITPFIDDDGNILLEVLPSIQDAELQLGIPVVKTTKVSTWLMAKSGETVFIGGLIKDNKLKTQDMIPCFGSIPGFGTLFGRTVSNYKKEELVVLITPRVLGDDLQSVEAKEKEKIGKSVKGFKKIPIPPGERIYDFISPIK